MSPTHFQASYDNVGRVDPDWNRRCVRLLNRHSLDVDDPFLAVNLSNAVSIKPRNFNTTTRPQSHDESAATITAVHVFLLLVENDGPLT